MMKVPNPGCGVVRRFGLAAAALLALTVATGQRAEALSLINPGAAPVAKYASEALTTEIRGGHGGGFHGGGGGGFRGGGGGFRGGGAAFHHGGFRGGAYRFASRGIVRHHYFGPRRAYWHHRHHFRPRYHGYGPVYYSHRFCRVVWTHYGPRTICRYRPWHHHHWRRHYRHHVYW